MAQAVKSASRNTRRRARMLEVLTASPRPLTAEELRAAVQTEFPIDRSTVYRALAAWEEQELVQRTLLPDGTACYERAGRHVHHLVCAQCKAIVPIDGCPLRALGETLSAETGYIITGHSLEFTGICPRCAGKQGEERP